MTDTLKHVSLGDACSKEGQSNIDAVNIGDTSDAGFFYESLGYAKLNTYQKTHVLHGYFVARGDISYETVERTVDINAGIQAGAMSVDFPLVLDQETIVRKVACNFTTNNSDYSVTFNLKHIDAKSLSEPITLATKTFYGQSGSKFLVVDFSSLVNPSRLRVGVNKTMYLNIVIQSNAVGGTHFFANNPIVTWI